MPRRASWSLVGLLGIIAVLATTSLLVIYGTRLNYPPIRSDGMGYYLYLPAALIDHDLSLRTTIRRSFDNEVPEWAGVNRLPEHRLVIKYPVGEALLLLPFFTIAQCLALATGGPATGFSPVYHASVAAAGVAYLVAGLVILSALLRRHFSHAVVLVTLAVMTFGTNLFHYATYDSALSHVFSFFLFTCFLASCHRWHEALAEDSPTSPAGWSRTLTLALVAGLITLVRPTNSVIFLFALAGGVTTRSEAAARVRRLRRHWPWLVAGTAVYLVVLGIQFSYWKVVSGRWFLFAYGDEAFFFAHPETLRVLFSIRKGLFFWSPALLLAVTGVSMLRRQAPGLVWPTIVYMTLNVWIIASWHDWAYGGSFGHRAFTESIAVLSFGYAAWLQAMWRSRLRRGVALALSLALCAVSVRLMIGYWTHVIPYDHATLADVLAALP